MVKTNKVESSIRVLDKSLEVFSLFTVLISVTLAVFSVVFRYLFDISFQIIEEICRYSIIYGVFAYIGPLIKKNEHLKMDLIQNFLKGKVKHYNDLLISIILFASFVFICWSSVNWSISLLNMNLMTDSGIVLMFIPALAIPLGMFFSCIYSFLKIIEDFDKIRLYKSEV